MARSRSALALITVAALVGCSGSDETSADGSPGTSPGGTGPASTMPSAGESTASTSDLSATMVTVDSGPAPTATEAAATTTVETATTTSTTSSTASTTSRTSSTTSKPPAPTTTFPDVGAGWNAPPENLLTLNIDVPPGQFVGAPGDLVVLRTNGDLEYRPNALAPSPRVPADFILLLDRPDPRVEAEEGEGPNVVADIAGIVDGSVIYGDCCEPVSGNIFAVDAPGSDVGPLAVGSTAETSPDGSRLAVASPAQLSVFDIATGEGIGIVLDRGPDEPFRTIVDLGWIDDDVFMTLTIVDGTYRLSRYNAANLARGSSESAVNEPAEVDTAQFAGRTPDGEVGVVVSKGDQLTVNYLDQETFGLDLGDRTQTFPSTVSAIEIDAGGLGQIWVDDGTLFYLPPGSYEARPLGDGIRAAWFVNTP